MKLTLVEKELYGRTKNTRKESLDPTFTLTSEKYRLHYKGTTNRDTHRKKYNSFYNILKEHTNNNEAKIDIRLENKLCFLAVFQI